MLCWQVQVIQLLDQSFKGTSVHVFSAVDQQPVGSLSWLGSGAGAAMLVGNGSNSTLRLWTVGQTQATSCQALHLHAAPGKVRLLLPQYFALHDSSLATGTVLHHHAPK